jgi:hypothetical protein
MRCGAPASRLVPLERRKFVLAIVSGRSRSLLFFPPTPGEGAPNGRMRVGPSASGRRCPERRMMVRCQCDVAPSPAPHPALRATFSRWEKARAELVSRGKRAGVLLFFPSPSGRRCPEGADEGPVSVRRCAEPGPSSDEGSQQGYSAFPFSRWEKGKAGAGVPHPSRSAKRNPDQRPPGALATIWRTRNLQRR